MTEESNINKEGTVYTDGIQTLTRKVLKVPTIDDFTLAQHNHNDSMGGGDLVLSQLSVYANNIEAKNGGLTAGRLYRTSTGQLMVVY